MLPQSILRIIAGVVTCALACIGMVLQNAFFFATESAKHVAQLHGVMTPEMRDHLRSQACFALVFFCAGALGGSLVMWAISLPIRLALFLVHLAVGVLYEMIRFWCQPLQPLVRLVVYCARRLVRALP